MEAADEDGKPKLRPLKPEAEAVELTPPPAQTAHPSFTSVTTQAPVQARTSLGPAPVRMSRSMVLPAEPFAAPKAWVFRSSGGSLPCAQSFQRVVSTSYPSSSWPFTPRIAAPVNGAAPGQVVVVRELSPGRPLGAPMATQRALSPTLSTVHVAHHQAGCRADGQVSPPLMAQPRSLSPPIAARQAHTPVMPSQELYGSFEFYSRGMQGKSYRCRSRLTREEHICRQVCKDKVPAPSDLVRAEALGNLLKSHHKSKLQEITAGLTISEQISSPFSAIGAALALQQSFAASEIPDPSSSVSMTEAKAALSGLGMSEKGMEKVLKAFADDEGNKVNHKLLISHCSELAEDLLDHALWRVFTAAGEDHRGVLGAAELEKALAESGGSGADKAGGEGPGTFGSEMKASEIVRQIARGQEVTFEELKAAILQRQSTPYKSMPNQ
eukprot:g30513.t1